jgi:hybrid cluster-associated redox disulfide protein
MSLKQSGGPITADCLMRDVVKRHPQAIVVLMRHGLQCAGCTISPFHTIADTARANAVAVDLLLNDLNQAIAVEMS